MTQRLGHKYLVDTVNAICCVAGSKEYRCDICGDNYIEIVPPTGHTWNTGTVTTKATATTDGIRTYTCISCRETMTEIIPATGAGNVSQDDKNISDKDNDDISDKENTNTDEEDFDADEEETDILEAGDMVEDVSNGDEYEIISVKGNVVCVEYLESANVKASTVTISATIKTEEGIVCKVIGTKAFSGCRNLTSVRIGKNVTTIGVKAFKGIPMKTVIQVPKGKQTVYKKLFLSKGLGKKNKIR